VTLLAIIALAGCVAHPVGPARTYGSFAAKASTTVESAISAIETVRLLASAASDGGAFSSYVAVSVSEQEDSLGGVRGTFASIQPPPSADAAALRTQLLALLDRAFAHVGDVRIEARRGHLDLDVVSAPLAADSADLNALLDTLP
jgi:hypothetical protein